MSGKIEPARQIERHKTERQVSRQRVGKFCLDRRIGAAFLRDRGEAVIQSYDDVGSVEQAELKELRTDARQVIIGSRQVRSGR